MNPAKKQSDWQESSREIMRLNLQRSPWGTVAVGRQVCAAHDARFVTNKSTSIHRRWKKPRRSGVVEAEKTLDERFMFASAVITVIRVNLASVLDDDDDGDDDDEWATACVFTWTVKPIRSLRLTKRLSKLFNLENPHVTLSY